MSLIGIILALAIAGFLCWIVLQMPVPAPFKNIIIGIVALVLVVWVLQELGVHTGLPRMRL